MTVKQPRDKPKIAHKQMMESRFGPNKHILASVFLPSAVSSMSFFIPLFVGFFVSQLSFTLVIIG